MGEKCLVLNSVERPTIDELCSHPWLRDDHDTSNAPQLNGVLNNVNKLRSQTKLRQEVLSIMSTSMSKEEIAELKQMFEAADADGDGNLTADELRGALKNTTSFSEDDMKSIIAMADGDDDGMLSFTELLQGAVQQKLVADEERVWIAFQKFDNDGDGSISVREMAEVLGKDESECKEMFDEVDKDQSGLINYDEFIQMWAKNTGGYLWDQDASTIEADIQQSKEEIATRKATVSGAVTVTETKTATGDGATGDGATGDGAAAPAPAGDGVADLLASLQNNDDDDDDAGGDDDWLAMAMGDDEVEETPKEKKKKGGKKKDKGGSKKKDKGGSKKKDKGGSKKKDEGGSKKKD